MLRLFQWALMMMFGFMLWRIFRIMSGSGRSRKDERSIYDPPASKEPPQIFNDVKDADFVDLKPSDKDKKSDSTQ